jgi:hypothetical protein
MLFSSIQLPHPALLGRFIYSTDGVLYFFIYSTDTAWKLDKPTLQALHALKVKALVG